MVKKPSLLQRAVNWAWDKTHVQEEPGATIRSVDENVPITLVTATRGKHVRAQPILSLFEQGRAHTLQGMARLEEQLSAFSLEGYEADGSPDSADAFVWAATELTTSRGAQVFV